MHKSKSKNPAPNWSLKRTPTLAMASPFSWPVSVPFALSGSGAAYLGRWAHRMMRYCVLLLMWAQCAGAVEPVFWSETETGLEQTISAPPGLIQFVLREEDSNDRRILHECMQEEHLKKGQEAALFSVSRVSLNGDKSPAYFVRPALKPFCMAFYGAHLFRYWFVSSSVETGRPAYRMVFKDGSDGVGVLPTSTKGYSDLLHYSYNAVSQYWVTLAFNGHEYEEKDCVRKDFQENGTLKSLPCQPE